MLMLDMFSVFTACIRMYFSWGARTHLGHGLSGGGLQGVESRLGGKGLRDNGRLESTVQLTSEKITSCTTRAPSRVVRLEVSRVQKRY